jgi:hypothetical protein
MRYGILIVLVGACAAQPVARPQVRRTAPRAPLATSPVVTPPSLTPDVVLATIRSRYLGGIERCYRRHLKHQATSAGRVLVSFTVDPSGHAREGAARGIADRVEGCITAQIAQWRFPAPTAEARFALGLDLFTN